jgi:rhamnopyranosyl-N-acetylglucosaminyl-diphospho-decaprenol beta-1,3/1,4-galactofuranosyltransferase
MSTVAAVVVTFNRCELVVACLDALSRQERPLDRIFIIDNASTDATPEVLAKHGYRDRADVTYVRLDRNTGGAGGFHEGMRLAHEAGFDWIWIMDDDGEPCADALRLMEAHFDEPDVVAVLPMIAHEDGSPAFDLAHRGFLTLPPARITGEQFGRAILPAEFNGRETIDIDYYSFVGPCFARTAIDRAGLPLAQFFIHYDDSEYAYRLSLLGRAVLVTAARILDRQAQQADLVTVRGRRIFPMDKLWIRYFGYRNRVWLILHDRFPASKLDLLVEHLRFCARIMLYQDHKWRRLRFFNAAFWDGVRGRFDNSKPRRLLG